MVVDNELYVLVEDRLSNKLWRKVTQVNLGSMNKPNKEILQIKYIIR